MHETIYFAAGCFWGVQYYFDQVPGVIATEVGYAGGYGENPTWEDVYSHRTGHAETLKVEFDPKVVSVETLVRQFFYMHDPTQTDGQGPDIGDSYRSEIFVLNDGQREIAQKVLDELNESTYDGKIFTKITPFTTWWTAEDFHQKFSIRTGRGMCHKPYKAMAQA